MFIKPCHRCPLKDGCEQREVFRTKARGTGALSIAFKCQRLEKELRVGRRIIIKHPFLGDDERYGEYEQKIHQLQVKASIQTVHKTKFTALIDEGQNVTEKFRRRRTMGHARIVNFLDEPDAPTTNIGNDHRPDIVLTENAEKMQTEATELEIA